MPVFDTFSYRQRIASGEMPDIFVYDELPDPLRNQIIHIWGDAIGPFYVDSGYFPSDVQQNNGAWRWIHNAIAREHGLLDLGNERDMSTRCKTYLLQTSVNYALDLIEMSFKYIDSIGRKFSKYDQQNRGITVTADEAIKELNERFRRAGVGYQFEDGMIFRVDSELIHSEITQPALRYLHQQGFEGPRDEFLKAHAHYRSGDMKDAITDANNAFESTLKAICDQRDWGYQQGARASDLLKVVRGNGLLPDYLDKSFDQLVGTLKSGLPKVRNAEGSHGQGSTPRETPEYVAAYALHLVAATILFLAEAHKNTDGT